ncbi:MAG TPA: protease modulator HflK [Candidatus Limnocylindria bacterium]|nr:protease modulator HflK [Candidatus Limnocylindria bacterium]
MEQNRTKLTLVNLLALLIAGGVGLAIARSTHVLSAYVALCFLGIGFLVTLVSYFQMRLVERERLERLEYDELTKSPSASALFNKEENAALPARRSREQFEKFFIPGFTVALLLAEAAGVFFLWRWLNKPAAPFQQPLFALVVFALLALVLFLLGRFSATLVRLEKNRLLQPVASFVLASGYLCAIVSAAIVATYSGVSRVDLYVARALIILLGALAIETLLTLLLEIYRPRVKGREARLLYDSRFIGLLSQPESLFTTAAHALDYQFGFKVSETWFFQFLQRAFAWIVIAQLAILLLSTSFVVIETGEQALLERFGKPVAGNAILDPGVHFKWPWPIDKIHRYRTERVQTFSVGLEHDERAEKETTVLWTVSHAKEEFNLLVASRDTSTNADASKKSPPVNLLSVSIPVQFQITNLTAWAYNNSEPDHLLEKIATREVVLYLVNADLNEIMSSGRTAGAEALRVRIQSAADERKLGARIMFVGLQDIHPPVKVAEAYERVVGARQSAEAKVNAAKAHAIQTNALAGAQARRTVLLAEAEATRTKSIALARAASFTNQIPAYRAAPTIYTERAYLQTLAANAANVRKYVNLATNTDDVIAFNLEEKFERSLLDVTIPSPKTK